LYKHHLDFCFRCHMFSLCLSVSHFLFHKISILNQTHPIDFIFFPLYIVQSGLELMILLPQAKTTRQSVSGTLPQDPSYEYGNFYTLFFLFK
jgi:hypothetical protein